MNSDSVRLHGSSVLVKSAVDHRDPPIAMRGTVDTQSTPGTIKILLDFPDMGATPAHRGIIKLDHRALSQLVASERDGIYQITIPDSLESFDPPPAPHPFS